jgi:hypothetical protein
MDRRDLLKTVGGIGVTASAAGAGVLATSGSAAAQAEVGTFDISNAEITTDGGTIDGYKVEPEVAVEYDGLDEPAEGVRLQFGVFGPDGQGSSLSDGLYDNNPNLRKNVSDVGSMDTRAGEVHWDLPAMDVLANSNWEASDFEDTTEGDGPELTEVTFYVQSTIQGADGTIDPPGYIRETGTVQVRVTNEAVKTDAGATGDTTLEGENQENN